MSAMRDEMFTLNPMSSTSAGPITPRLPANLWTRPCTAVIGEALARLELEEGLSILANPGVPICALRAIHPSCRGIRVFAGLNEMPVAWG